MADFKPFIPKEQKLGAGAYCELLWRLLPEIKRNIEESPTNITSISINDFKKKLGARYKPHSPSTVYYSTKYGLIEERINVQRTKDDHMLMRYRSEEDRVPKGFVWAKEHGFVCKEGKRLR